jgi:cytochrome c553
MRWALLLALAAGSLWAYDEAKFSEGKDLFKRCAACHGQFGHEKAMGQSGEISRLEKSEIEAILGAYAAGASEGAMRAQASLLDSKKIEALAVYISNMIEVRGRELFELRCASCHGADGNRAAFGQSDLISGKSESELAAVIEKYRSGEFERGTTASAMKGRAANLSDHDVTALARYISTLK